MQLSTLEVPKSSHNSYVLSLEQKKLGHPHEKINVTLGKFVYMVPKLLVCSA